MKVPRYRVIIIPDSIAKDPSSASFEQCVQLSDLHKHGIGFLTVLQVKMSPDRRCYGVQTGYQIRGTYIQQAIKLFEK